ncbi:hypothetical protein [Streptomyces albospinus]|uniref:hypothetical protein n=1 Tax=Streptomyces albospinus TaxID=285515 RepID=UPI0016713AEB|nr:hypothetical protein [Streptomyces albospinus]
MTVQTCSRLTECSRPVMVAFGGDREGVITHIQVSSVVAVKGGVEGETSQRILGRRARGRR